MSTGDLRCGRAGSCGGEGTGDSGGAEVCQSAGVNAVLGWHLRALRGSETHDDGNGDDGEPHFD